MDSGGQRGHPHAHPDEYPDKHDDQHPDEDEHTNLNDDARTRSDFDLHAYRYADGDQYTDGNDHTNRHAHKHPGSWSLSPGYQPDIWGWRPQRRHLSERFYRTFQPHECLYYRQQLVGTICRRHRL